MNEPAQKAWICPICGYVHYGPEAPDVCPVCGTAKEMFEPDSAPAPEPTQWRCSICGYIHDGTQPPDECPVCSTAGSLFEPLETTSAVSADDGEGVRVVIVGAGIAGVSAAEALRKAAAKIEIILFSADRDLPYYRLNLTRYLAGEVSAAQLPIHPASWYAENRIQLERGVEVTTIDPGGKSVSLSDGRLLGYDRMILTAGSRPFTLLIPGVELAGVTTLRTRRDADAILSVCTGKQVVIIGGGLLGLETAGALVRRGAQVTVLENQAWFLPRQLNQRAAGLLQAKIEALGITLRTNAKTRELYGGETVTAVALEDGTVLPADLVIFSAGVRSRIELARLAGIAVNQGVIVDGNMRTSAKGVFAAGDIAEHEGTLYGTWSPAQAQGVIAGMNAAGVQAQFSKLPRSNTLKVLGIDLFSVGRFIPQDEADTLLESETDGGYACLLFREDHLQGAILFGSTDGSGRIKQAIEGALDFSAVLKPGMIVADMLAYLNTK